MEPRLQHDFSHVRVHANPQAAESAAAVNALAYTVGHDVVFGAGQYAPHSKTGRRLIAHELTHVVQQARGGTGGDAELRADVAAERASRAEPVSEEMAGGAPASVQKADKDIPASGSANVAQSATLPNLGEPPIDEFEFDKADIPPQHLGRLAALRAALISTQSAVVTLIGHTDRVGLESYNTGLGMRRAAAVRDFLTKQNGVTRSRIRIESRGETEPAVGKPPAKLDPSKGEKDPKNRRVEIRIEGLAGGTGTASQPTTGRTFDQTDPKKKPPIKLDLPPRSEPNPPSAAPPKDRPPTPTSPTVPEKEGGLQTGASVVLDPIAGNVDTQVELKLSYNLAGRRIKLEFPLTLHFGPNGFSEAEIEAALSARLADKILGGVVTEPTVFVSFNPGVGLDKSNAMDFSAKLKTGLSAALNIKGTPIRVPIEVSVFADPLGKPGGEVKITIFSF
jgi:outer membrane protein OmpA-like peptidoglycan-associated protein